MIVSTYTEFEADGMKYKLHTPTEDTVQPIIDFFRSYRRRLKNTDADTADQIPDAVEMAAARKAIEPLLIERQPEMVGTLAEALIFCQMAITLYAECFSVPEIKKK